MRRRRCDAGHQRTAEHLDETFARADCEDAVELRHVDLASWRLEDCANVAHECMNDIAQLDRPRRWHQATSCSDEERIASSVPKPRQGPAHCRRAQSQLPRGPGHAPLGQKCVECIKQVQIEVGHSRDHARSSCNTIGVWCNDTVHPLRLAHSTRPSRYCPDILQSIP